jgi:hypothetical protein
MMKNSPTFHFSPTTGEDSHALGHDRRGLSLEPLPSREVRDTLPSSRGGMKP